MKRIVMFLIAAIFALTTGAVAFAAEGAGGPPTTPAAPTKSENGEKKPAKKKPAKKKAKKAKGAPAEEKKEGEGKKAQ